MTASAFHDRGRGNHIQDEAAYAEATKRRIKDNARKGKSQRWLAGDPTRAALANQIRVHIFGSHGELNPRRDSFIVKMYESLEEYGSLTEKQEAAVRERFAKAAERKAEFAARDAGSLHVGTVGERRTFTLSVTATFDYETDFGRKFVYIMKDGENVLVYKGNQLQAPDARWPVAKGATITVKATIKEHGEREGVKQTILSRP